VTHAKILTVYNKLDKLPETNKLEKNSGIYISALSGAGVASLEDAIIEIFIASNNENVEFSARERHLIALKKAINAIDAIEDVSFGASPELVAEDYREATGALQEIGGEYSTEDLLGDIFSKFCIGK
jgi:tRNA modification GTPase